MELCINRYVEVNNMKPIMTDIKPVCKTAVTFIVPIPNPF